MEGSAADDLGAPESWEVADLDATMSRLGLSSDSNPHQLDDLTDAASSAGAASASAADNKFSEDVINQVDQFLREAIQNPRERLSSKFVFRFFPVCLFCLDIWISYAYLVVYGLL